MRLTEQELLDIIALRNQNLSIRKISEVTGIPKSTVGDILSGQSAYAKEFYDSLDKKVVGGEESNVHDGKESKIGAGKYIITSAQNNTAIHEKAWSTLNHIADHYGAELLVSTYTYNINGFQNLTKSQGDLWYDPRIVKHRCDKPVELAPDLLLCGELNILPTAVNPLSGFQNYVTSHSGIIPHAKLALESLPRHKKDLPRFLYTTGSITLPNYIEKKSGQKASFYHAIAALYVEVDDDGNWWCRQLHAEKQTGIIYDLTNKFTPEGLVSCEAPVEAVNLGDLHLEKSDNEVLGLSTGLIINEDYQVIPYNQGSSILADLKPNYIFCHDTADFSARNHHNINDHYFNFTRYKSSKNSVENEIQMIADFLGELAYYNCGEVVVVESNHDEALTKWLMTSDYRNDPVNARYFLELQLDNYKAMENFVEIHTFKNACIKANKLCENVNFLKVDDSFRLFGEAGIECGSHGHNGTNGARGSVSSFSKMGLRYNVGHSHSAAIHLGCFYAGVTGSLDMGYNKGGTTWSHSHIITYANGKRTIITYRGGRFY